MFVRELQIFALKIWFDSKTVLALHSKSLIRWYMEKYILDPKAPGAFTSEMMHKVVLTGIDSELQDDIWDAIHDAFGH